MQTVLQMQRCMAVRANAAVMQGEGQQAEHVHAITSWAMR